MNTNMNKTNLILPQPLHDILIGYMLGDGGIYYASKKSKIPRFEFSIGGKYKDFALHISTLFNPWAKNGLKTVMVKSKVENLGWKNGGDDQLLFLSYRFKTQSLPVFIYYRNLFYNDINVKIVPKQIESIMSPLVLAYLIMSDGNYDQTAKRVRIYTNSFTLKEVELLAIAMITKLSLKVEVIFDRISKTKAENQYILVIKTNQLKELQSLVEVHMLPSMKYRIGI